MAPVKDSNIPLPRSYVEQYWQLVRKSLKNIFSKSPNEADALQQTIENLPTAQQDFFYNEEPLNVAADLVGENPTDTQIKVYLWLRTVEDLKQILEDYNYLEYDETLSNPGLVQINVTSQDANRNVQVITDICHKLETVTHRNYFFTYGGNYTETDNLEKVWSFFTLKEVDLDQHAEIELVYEIIKDARLPTFQIDQIAA
ncbi:hypothetical protein C6503_23555 [Candidatus Poribacteria bacterium]|nr:MAG: hypothetical protein C6503_23555 [Candidatus Poribacteria bacterium]